MNATAAVQTAAATATKFAVRPAQYQVEVPGENGRVYCRCSTTCGAATWNLFAQGHDARLVSRLVDEVVAQRLTKDEAVALVRKAGGDERLVTKLVQAVATAHDKWLKRQDAAARRAAKRTAKAAAQPKVVTAKVGRWTYQGTVSTDGLCFTYTDRKGVEHTTAKFNLV